MIEQESLNHWWFWLVAQGQAGEIDNVRTMRMFDFLSSFEMVMELVKQRQASRLF